MSKETGGFFRKVVRFVANPTTEWSSLETQEADAGESEYAKSEIKAMIERKRRNDFVRKREFDMLRKIRREGLSADAAMALNTPSNLDPDSRPHTNGAPSDMAVKDKIDAIEQQMVGSNSSRSGTRPPAHVPTLPLDFGQQGAQAATERPTQAAGLSTDIAMALDLVPSPVGTAAAAANEPRTAAATASAAPAAPPLAASAFMPQLDLQVAEMVHDPELDEAVIAFANADFDQCERCLLDLIQPGAARFDHTETWMALFDFYRALDLPQPFDNLAVTFAQKFGLSAPQWYSLPDKVARFLAQQKSAAKAPAPAAVNRGTRQTHRGAECRRLPRRPGQRTGGQNGQHRCRCTRPGPGAHRCADDRVQEQKPDQRAPKAPANRPARGQVDRLVHHVDHSEQVLGRFQWHTQVDDDDVMRQLAICTLQQAGFDVVEAGDGAQQGTGVGAQHHRVPGLPSHHRHQRMLAAFAGFEGIEHGLSDLDHAGLFVELASRNGMS